MASTSGVPAHDVFYDAGDMACGDLVLRLRIELKKMSAGQVLELRATDVSAPIDLPAWCRLTGHRLMHQSGCSYWIEKSGEA